jgi:hypothetical protein
MSPFGYTEGLVYQLTDVLSDPALECVVGSRREGNASCRSLRLFRTPNRLEKLVSSGGSTAMLDGASPTWI